jgi:hypothetical protein
MDAQKLLAACDAIDNPNGDTCVTLVSAARTLAAWVREQVAKQDEMAAWREGAEKLYEAHITYVRNQESSPGTASGIVEEIEALKLYRRLAGKEPE